MTTTTDRSTPTPSANGDLINRVQQLRLDGQLGAASARGGRGSWLPWVLCGMMAVAWAGVGVRMYKAEKDGANGGPAAGAKGGGSAGPAAGSANPDQSSAAPGELNLQIKGVLTPSLQINLSPDDVSGVVAEIDFKEGDRVKKGHVLARLRNERYTNDFNFAKASKEAAQARAARAVSAVESARAKVARAVAFEIKAANDLERAERSTTVAAAQDIVKAIADDKGAKADVRAAEADVRAAEADQIATAADLTAAVSRAAEAERMLKNCEVKAPIDGTVLTKVADRGVLVSPMSFNVAAGICSLADLSDMEAEVDVREDQITKLHNGLECQVAAVANPNRIYRGRVDRVMPIADDTKNTIKVRVKVQLPPGEEPGAFLKPKMSVVVRVYNSEIADFAAKK